MVAALEMPHGSRVGLIVVVASIGVRLIRSSQGRYILWISKFEFQIFLWIIIDLGIRYVNSIFFKSRIRFLRIVTDFDQTIGAKLIDAEFRNNYMMVIIGVLANRDRGESNHHTAGIHFV